VYNGKIQDFLTSTRSTLPVIAVDVPASILAQLAINTSWITEDEAWKAVLTDPAIDDRKYAETVREGVRKLVKDENQNVIWLFGVREGKEGKVRFMTFLIDRADGHRGSSCNISRWELGH
jgi:translation initiation factor 2-alpha kinase 4